MEEFKKILSRAVIRMLNPMVRLLLRFEISHSEFSELTKRAYVNIAFKHFSIPNRIKTSSRVAVITGLSRKEVVRITKIAVDQPPQTKGPLNRANRVIGGWLADGEFSDADNKPRQLSLRGEAFSFEALVDRYSGGTTYRAILDELIRVGTVSLLDKKIVKLNHHGYIPNKNTAEMTDIVSTHVADLLSTVVHNLNQPSETRFQRQVTYANVPDSVAKEFKQLSHDKSHALMLELNQWLASQCKGTEPKPEEQTSRVGVGIYYFNNERDEE